MVIRQWLDLEFRLKNPHNGFKHSHGVYSGTTDIVHRMLWYVHLQISNIFFFQEKLIF